MALHYWSFESVQLPDSWLTIGAFDGVHLGHQAILNQLTAGARQANVPAVVLTFYPHPARVLSGSRDVFYLTSPEQRRDLLAQAGADIVITHPFSHALSQIEAEDFIAQLHARLGFRQLWIGYDFALGKGRRGNAQLLQQLGEQFGYQLHVIEPVQAENEPVSSSRVRRALKQGDVQTAAQLLGRSYSIRGRVIPGDGRGRTIGIPTANLQVWEEQVIPGPGVYVSQAEVKGQTWGAVTNVGYRPTFDNQPERPQVEAHLLDFEADLYGREVNLSFIARLRPEQRFASVQTLVEQIQKDIARGRSILSQQPVSTRETG
jgi:riboflavin kinase / FMN adenylyltransferase